MEAAALRFWVTSFIRADLAPDTEGAKQAINRHIAEIDKMLEVKEADLMAI